MIEKISIYTSIARLVVVDASEANIKEIVIA
jgi:hypothetical protein